MSGAALAVGVISAAAGVAGSAMASKEQGGAVEGAARTEAEAMSRGQDIQREMFEKQLDIQEPYRQAGYGALPKLRMQATGQAPQMTEAELAELESLRAKQQRAGDILQAPGPVEGWRDVPKYISASWDPLTSGGALDLNIPPTTEEGEPTEDWLRSQNLWREQQAAPDLTEEELERLQELQVREQQYQQLQEEGVPTATEMMGPEQRETYNRLAEFTQDPLEESPYYQWRLGEGENAINKAMAARGLQMSRPAINELSDYRRALTGEMTQQRYNRLGQQYNTLQGARQNRFNKLAQMANIGQGAAAQGQQAAGQFGTQMANMYMQGGQQQAQRQMQQGNIQANMWSNLGAMPMNALQTYTYGKASGVFD